MGISKEATAGCYLPRSWILNYWAQPKKRGWNYWATKDFSHHLFDRKSMHWKISGSKVLIMRALWLLELKLEKLVVHLTTVDSLLQMITASAHRLTPTRTVFLTPNPFDLGFGFSVVSSPSTVVASVQNSTLSSFSYSACSIGVPPFFPLRDPLWNDNHF